MTRRTEILTGSCAVEWRWRRIRAMKRGGWTCIARSAAITATATNTARRRKVIRGSRLVSRMATATMGPNSPMAPTDRIDGPTGVRSTPASRKMGSSVPRAVVVRHRATTTESSTRPVACRKTPTPKRQQQRGPPRSRGTPQVPLAHGRQVELGAGQEHEVGQAEIGQRRHDGVRVGEVQHEGPDQDPEEDLDHDLGHGDEAPQPFRDDRRQDRRQPDEDQGGNGTLRSCVSCSPRDRPLWHAAPPPGHPRYAPRPWMRVISAG